MKVIVSGTSGLIGAALGFRLTEAGHDVGRLVRSAPSRAGDVAWNPAEGTIDAARLAGCDAVVHLAGESIAEGRWNDAKKERIRRSRVAGTELLAKTFAGLDRPPQVFCCASAIGFYGDRGDEVLTETSSSGTGFLPEVCRAWEAACDPAREAGIRTVNLRIGVVLAQEGGALAKMLTPFKLGVGGKIGSGRQWMSWVSRDDLVRVIEHSLTTPSLSGPVNAVSGAVTNQDFTKTLGRVLRRPTIFPMPAFAARSAFGEMADALLLASTRVEPTVLRESGFRFEQETLEAALRHHLGR